MKMREFEIREEQRILDNNGNMMSGTQMQSFH